MRAMIVVHYGVEKIWSPFIIGMEELHLSIRMRWYRRLTIAHETMYMLNTLSYCQKDARSLSSGIPALILKPGGYAAHAFHHSRFTATATFHLQDPGRHAAVEPYAASRLMTAATRSIHATRGPCICHIISRPRMVPESRSVLCGGLQPSRNPRALCCSARTDSAFVGDTAGFLLSALSHSSLCTDTTDETRSGSIFESFNILYSCGTKCVPFVRHRDNRKKKDRYPPVGVSETPANPQAVSIRRTMRVNSDYQGA